MAPDVALRKISVLRQLLADLEPFEDATLEEVTAEHYQVERILELLATAGADLVQHLLAERGVVADSYRDAFRQAAAAGLLDPGLARRLEGAAGMRNVLAHLYESIDYAILRASIPEARRDFAALIVSLAVVSRPTDEA